jgi:hypothetical protein
MTVRRRFYSRMLSRGSHTSARSLLNFLMLVTLSGTAFLILSRRKKMNTINKDGTALFLELCNVGFLPDTAQFITAQAAHESNNFTSEVFLKNNNPFGMRVPEVRITTAKTENLGYAVYDNLQDAAKDYWYYYLYNKFPFVWNDVTTFVEALKAHSYFEGPLNQYIIGVKHFYKLYFQ